MARYQTNAPGWEVYNFNFNDGITTTQIVGTATCPYKEESDYLILEDNYNNLSYWFILESVYEREGQYRLTLRKDFGPDYSKCDVLVKRGYVDRTSNLIFNPEGLTFNKILKERHEITDNTHSPWYVAYVSKDFARDAAKIFDFTTVTKEANITTSTLSNWKYYYCVNNETKFLSEIQFDFKNQGQEINNQYQLFSNRISFKANPSSGEYTRSSRNKSLQMVLNETNYPHLEQSVSNSTALNNAKNFLNENPFWNFGYAYDNGKYKEILNFSAIRDLNDQYIKTTNDNKLYRIKVEIIDEGAVETISTLPASLVSSATTLATHMVDIKNWKEGAQNLELTWVEHINLVYSSLKIILTEVAGASSNYSITINTDHQACNDAPYDIITWPARDLQFKIRNPDNPSVSPMYKSSTDVAAAFAAKLAEQPQDLVFDIQLFPFSSVPRSLIGNNTLLGPYCNFSGLLSSKYALNTGASPIGITDNLVLFYPESCKFKSSLTCDLKKGKDLTNINKLTGGFKRASECDFWRLNSPNLNSSWDFNAAKMDGFKYFSCVCQMKPQIPYIQVFPYFSRLYGSNLEDCRGLICSGDFSITRTRDQWLEYEMQNKNYKAMFEREIENLSINQDVQRNQQITSSVLGALTTGVQTGASVGLATANPVAGVIAGVGGAAVSAVGGALDYHFSETLRDETMSFKNDMFNLNIETIQARPRTINNISTINPRNTGCVTVEYYTASDEEIDGFMAYLDWYGMNINRVGKINDYLKPSGTTFISGRILRFEGKADKHYLDEMNSELERGFYITR